MSVWKEDTQGHGFWEKRFAGDIQCNNLPQSALKLTFIIILILQMKKLKLRVVWSMKVKVMKPVSCELGTQASQSDFRALPITKVLQASWVRLLELGLNRGI